MGKKKVAAAATVDANEDIKKIEANLPLPIGKPPSHRFREPLPIGKPNGGVTKPEPVTPSGKRKTKEKAFGQFITDVLPSLKKEMVRKKKEVFDWENYAHYFKPDSGYTPTFMLPLFRFLLTDTIVCDRYGNFSNKHRVKTTAGHKRVMDLSENSEVLELTPEMLHFFSRRFGVEWFKIPAKDGFRAKAAAAAGYEGQFKVILVGMYEDEFTDHVTGETVVTINPTLTYEPVLPPAPKKERKPAATKSKVAAASEIAKAVVEHALGVPLDVGAQPEVIEEFLISDEE